MATDLQVWRNAQKQKKKNPPKQQAASVSAQVARPAAQNAAQAQKVQPPKAKTRINRLQQQYGGLPRVNANPVATKPADTLRGAVQQAYTASRGADEQTGAGLWDALAVEINTPGSAYYNAYFNPTSKAAQELTSLGIQVPDKIDDDWLSDAGAFIATYQRNTATGVSAAAPTKSSSAEENTAYWLSRFLEDYDTTQAAKNESLALDRELSYWIGRGYSDDAAIGKIDFTDYPTLAKMREAQGVGEPLQLTEALPFSDDWLYAKAWAARNPDSATGDYMTDLMQMGMGRGVSYKPDPQSDAARDPSNAETYNPYMFGATNDGLRMKYGVDSWDLDWLEQNRSMLNDEATADDWRTMYDAAQNTSTARAELETLQTEILAKIGRGKSFEEVFNDKFMNGFARDYPTLAKMEDYRYKGTSVELSDSVDFALPYFQQWVRDKIEERDAGIRETNDTIAADSEAAAAAAASTNPKTKGPEAAISYLEADMRLLQKTGMKLTAKAITPEALNAINALLPVSMTSEDAANRINEAMENGEELKIGKIFQSSAAPTANTKPMSATNAFTADDTLAELAGLKERALVGINVNPDKLPASVQGVIDDAFMEELTNAIRTDDEMAIRRLFDTAAQGVQDAANAPAPGETRAEGTAPQPVKVTTLAEDLQALKRRALSGEGIPIAALSETLLGAMQAATGMDAEALNAEMQYAVENGDMAALVGWIDQTTTMLSEQVADLEQQANAEDARVAREDAIAAESESAAADAAGSFIVEKSAEPIKKWDWADYYTKQSTMSATDFQRFKVEIQDGLLEYLKTGETTNAGALSFMDSYGDLFEGARLGFDNLGREVNVDLRKKYGNTIIDALDAINMDYVEGDQYIEAIFAASQAYEEAMSAEVAPEASEVLARDAEMQQLIDEGLIHPSEAYTVRRDSPEDVAAAQADAYFAENPQALETIINVAETSKASAEADEANRLAEQKALQDQAIAEREAFIETAVPTALEAFKAVNAGTADDNQSAIVRSARMVVTDTVRAQDDTYVKLNQQIMEMATGGFDPGMAASATYEESAQYQIGLAVSLLAMNAYDDHLGIAKNLNMSLAEFYQRYPELYVAPEQLIERARAEYTDIWSEFGNGVDGHIDAVEEIMAREAAQDKANQYDPEAAQRGGIGVMKAVGMGIETGWETHLVGWLDMFEAYCVMGVEGLDQEFNLRTAYPTRAEAYTDISGTVADVKDEAFRTDLEQELASTVDIYNFPLSPEAIRARDSKIELQNNIDAAAKMVAEYGTPLENTVFSATSSLTNTALMVGEYALANAATGATASVGLLPRTMQAINAAFVFGGAQGAEMAQDIYAKTKDRRAAVASGYALSGLIGALNSAQFQNINIPGVGTGKDGFIQAAMKTGASKLAIQNPGAAGRLVNAITYAAAGVGGLAIGEGLEEANERLWTEIAESLIWYGNTGEWIEPDYTGIISGDFMIGGIGGVIFGGAGAAINTATDVVTGNRARMRFDQAAILGAAVDGMAAQNLSIDIANGALNPILQGPDAANLTKAEADLVNARVIFADTQTTIAEQARLQADAEATFLNDVTDENLAVWDSATEALEAAQASLEGAQNKVATAEQAVQDARQLLFDTVAAQVDQIRAKARQDAEAALKDKNIIVAAKGAAKDIDTARAKLQALDPKSPAHAVLAAQVEAMETSKAAADFEAKNVGALMKPGTKRGEAARAQFDSLQAAKKAAQEQLTKLTPDPQKAAQDTLNKALTQYREGTAPSDMIALQGVKVAQLGVNLANAEKAYAQTQEALRNATADADVDALINADDAAKAALDNARGMYDTGKKAMRSAVTDVVTDTLAKSDSDLAQQIADAIAANDRQGVENLLAEAADAGILGFQGKPAAPKVEAQPVTTAPITAPVAPVNAEPVTATETIGDLTPESAPAAPVEPVTAEPAKAPYKPEHLIQNRARDTVGARNVRAFSNDFEEFKNAYGAAASILLFDLKATQKGQKIVIPVEGYDPDAKGGFLWSGQSRITSALLAEILDSGTENKRDWTYVGLESALLDFARAGEDGSAVPDDAAHKKLELFLHKMLTEGYEALDGTFVNPSFEYEVLVSEISGPPLTTEQEQEIFAKQSDRMNGVGVFEYAENPLGSVAEMANELMSGGEKAMDIAFRIAAKGKGAPSKPVQASMIAGGSVNPETKSGRIRNPVQIARSLIKALGVGDYIGAGNMNAGAQVTIPQTAQGYYVNRANYIVANRENAASFATTMHEAGHALSAKLGIDATDDMVKALPQALKDAYPQSSWRGEAFAEFVYDYMLNGRDSAIQHAGADFVNTFEEALRTNKLYDIVNEHAIAAREYVSSDADAKIRAVVVDTPPEADKEGFWTKAISRYVDSTRAIAPLDEAIGKAAGLSIRQQARYRTFRERMAVANLNKVGTDANGNIVGKSMAQTIKDAGVRGEDFNTLTDYMVAKHALDLMNRDEPITVLPDTITRAELEQLVADVESKNKVVADGAAAINAWWNDFMQRWFVDTGLLSQQEFDAMKAKNPHYVPLMKAYEDSGTGNKRGSSYKLTFIKSNTAEIANPFNSYAKIVREIGRLVAQNEVARAVHEAYQSNPGLGAFMRDVTPSRLPSAKAQAQAEIDEHASALGNPTGENPYAKFVVEGLKRSSLDPSTRILRGVDRDGKVFQYEIAHGQVDLMQVLGSPASAKTGLEGIGRLTRIMSMLITGKNPLFALRNAVRDIQSSINYGSWATTLFDGIPKWIAAMADVIANKDSYKQYVAMGGGGYSFLTSGTTKGNAEYRADLFKGSTDRSAGGMARYGGRKLLKLITLEGLNEAVEQTSRYAEFKYGKADAQGKYDRTTTEGKQRMLLSAQDVTVDFTLAGNSQTYRFLKQVTPFFGPSVQGVYRAFRMFSPEERGRLVPRLVKTVFNYSLRAAAQYALLSMFADDDDWDEYARLDDVYKAKHLFIPVKRFGGDDEGGMLAVKLPTSEDPVSRALYTLALWGVGQSSDKFSLDIMATVGGNIRDILPDGSIFSPIFDTINNQTYLGIPIVSQSLESRTGIDQYEDDTARSFVGLSKIMYDLTGGAANISPEKLQYVTEQYSGVLGQLLIPLMGTIGQADGAWYQRLWTDTSRQFMTDTTYSNRYGNLFYRNRDAFTEIIKAGDTGGVASDINPQLTDAEGKQAHTDAKALTSSGGAFNTASKNVAALYAEIDANNTNPNLTWAQRNDLNRVLRERINDEYNIANAEAEKYFGQYGIDRGIVGRFQVIVGGGSDAQKITAPTKIETLPDVFQGDVADGADYIERSEELIAENPTLTTVYPNPPRTFKDEGVEYTVGDDAWNDFAQTYYDTYIDFVENISDDDWASMDNEARVEFYRDAHREASEDAKRDYLMYYA